MDGGTLVPSRTYRAKVTKLRQCSAAVGSRLIGLTGVVFRSVCVRIRIRHKSTLGRELGENRIRGVEFPAGQNERANQTRGLTLTPPRPSGT